MTKESSTDLRQAAIAALPSGSVLVNGQPVAGSGAACTHIDPANGDVLRTWTLAGASDVELAVDTAASAQPAWAAARPAARRDALIAVASAITESTDLLAALVSVEMGMPLKASRAGVQAAAEWFSHYAGYADKIEGLAPTVGHPGRVLDYTRRVPYGVVAAIIPWNGPVMALALKAAPALAAGNAVVLKPSEVAPFSSLAFGALASAAGLPAGLLNVVAGGAEVGSALCAHDSIGLISFTGGSTGGRAVAEAAAARHVPTILELGGKSASLVFADVDVDRTAKVAAILGTAQNSGQGCFLPTRLLVERPIYDDVVDGVVAAAAKLRLGNPFEPNTNMGPVVNAAARDRILSVITAARERGDGRLVYGGAPAQGFDAGSYLEPTVFADVDPMSPLAQEEIFGPVLSIIPFDGEDDAVRIANGTRYGLAGYVWTSDLGRAHRVADALDAGNVSINGMSSLPAEAPFGGWKASGYGVEGSRAGLDEYLRTKNVHVQW
ncbi:aldehyde dehydrogenase family protein [Mycobacterium sp. 236(2023)]|uniref:aldehyde dehydrogenase family protein n=1 Tax=Mycobacterium sp. 236(2023) TaxID=3038163 RepID=UPI0024152570|nr:aldehyde dehydrogenase family protein [Mycobacterium sp. 236(2023)]MDG4668074.1 aldehyde dehydrogenase family protein [Mycobacterium sp. 236(2023)]